MKHIAIFSLALLFGSVTQAQEIIEEADTSIAEVKVEDSGNTFKAQKVDAVAAVVGDYIVLESDVVTERKQLLAQGADLEGVTNCQLFGSMLESKLYAHHAIQDSIEVSDAEVRGDVDYKLQQFLQSTNGSMDRLLAIYKKDNEKELRDEMFEVIKAGMLSQKMQKKIVDEVEITPEEVRQFFNNVPKEQRPTFGTELKVAEIVIEPKISAEEKQKVIDRLKEFKRDVLQNGASFRTKAVLYSEDKSSAVKGGVLPPMNRAKPQMVKEFREMAFSMQEGEISDPFETEYGFHIIKVDKVRGQEYDVSHILLFPKVSDDAVKDALKRINAIRDSIISEKITFSDAAKKYSERKQTRMDGGQMINPTTQDHNFELTKMEPELYPQIQGLKNKEVSTVQTETDKAGKRTFKLLMVTDRIDEHEANYARDYLKIKELALNEKKVKAIEKWQEEKIMDTYIKISDTYKDCDFASNWLKK